MSDPIVYGFQRSTYVNIVRLVLTHKNVPFQFKDLESVMGTPAHLALHPFDRVPILEHDDFRVYETLVHLDDDSPYLHLFLSSEPDQVETLKALAASLHFVPKP